MPPDSSEKTQQVGYTQECALGCVLPGSACDTDGGQGLEVGKITGMHHEQRAFRGIRMQVESELFLVALLGFHPLV